MQEDTFQQIGFKGEGKVTWDIPGWDRESLELKAKRDEAWSTGEVQWKFDIEVPRWGRSRDAVKSDYEAHKKVCKSRVRVTPLPGSTKYTRYEGLPFPEKVIQLDSLPKAALFMAIKGLDK